MGYLADIYIIKKTRSRQIAIDFLNHFIPYREESCNEYLIPEFESDYPIEEFDNSHELMSFLELNENYSQSLYWKNKNEKSLNKHGMVFYNDDGTMVFGISRNADMSGNLNTDNEDNCLSQMKEYFNTELGYIHYENPPAENYIEFVKIIDDLK